MTIIKFRRGNKSDLPSSAPSGMPLWCEDTKELYLGTGDNVTPIAASISLHTPYSVSSGNQDSSGYADLVSKVSDTEVSFKVGSLYPNMVVTFPNSKSYEISSVSNILGLNDNTSYTVIIFEDELLQQPDGTYSAIGRAVQSDLIFENRTLPDNAQDGSLGVIINPKPVNSYLKQTSSWVEKQFVKIAEVSKPTGIIQTPSSFAFNKYWGVYTEPVNYSIQNNVWYQSNESGFLYGYKHSSGTYYLGLQIFKATKSDYSDSIAVLESVCSSRDPSVGSSCHISKGEYFKINIFGGSGSYSPQIKFYPLNI